MLDLFKQRHPRLAARLRERVWKAIAEVEPRRMLSLAVVEESLASDARVKDLRAKAVGIVQQATGDDRYKKKRDEIMGRVKRLPGYAEAK